jgi:hypothetical protein
VMSWIDETVGSVTPRVDAPYSISDSAAATATDAP